MKSIKNNFILIGAIVALVLVAVLLWGYGFLGDNTVATEKDLNGRLDTITKLNENLRCSFSHDEGGNVTSGTVYVANSGAELRADFTVESDSQDVFAGTVLRTKNKSYVWGDFSDVGFVSNLGTENIGTLFTNNTATVPDTVLYTCERFPVTGDLFTLPEDREFIEFQT